MKTRSMHRSLLLRTALASGIIVVAQVPQAQAQVLPVGGTVVGGTGSADIGTVGNTMTVDINGTSPVIEWTTFDVAGSRTVEFVSVVSGSNTTAPLSVLNRVTGGGGNIVPSDIVGTIDATNDSNNNIAVWLVNPAGITFGGGAAFSGGSLILSTLDIADLDFTGGGADLFSLYAGAATVVGARSIEINDDIATSGDLVLIGQAISIGNGGGEDTVAAGGRMSAVVADSVTFGAGVGSPLSFTVNTGSTLAAAQLRVFGSATISGQSVSLVGVSQAVLVANMLQVDTGAEITASATSGVVTIASKSVGTVTVTPANVNDSVSYAAGSGPNEGIAVSGTSGAIQLASAGALSIDGDITAPNGTASFSAEGTSITLVNSSVSTAGTQTYTGPLTLTASTTLTGSTVSFTGAVDGDATPWSLDITGNASFGGTVGAGNNISTLLVSGTSAIGGGTVTTTGTQTYTGAATLGANTTLNASAVGFGGTLDSTGGARSLTVNAPVTFAGAVGATGPLLTLQANDTAAINGGSVASTGTQVYTGAVTLDADTSITASTVTFQSTLDSASATDRSLSITGNAVFDDTVGFNDELLSLSVSGTSAINGGEVTTSGTQTYSGAATIATGTTTLTGSLIRFGSTLEGTVADTDVLDIVGDARFDGSVGTSVQLLTLDVSGASEINGAAINTFGNQSYDGAATLGTGLHTLTAPLVTFGDTLEGPGGLTLSNAGTFTGTIGVPTRLASLSVPGALILGTASVLTTGDQTYGTNLVLDANRTFDSTSGTVWFQGTVNSDGTPRDLTITGNARFDDALGNTADLGALSVSGTSALNGGVVDTIDGQTYTGAVTLGANTTLTNTTTGLIGFGSTIDTDGTAWTLDIAGNASFGGAVGAGAILGAITVNAPATIVATGTLNSSGDITLNSGTSITTVGLTALGAASDILINQTGVPGTVEVDGPVSAGQDFRLKATTVTGLGGVQGAVGVYDITSTVGGITGAATLAVSAATVVLDSASGITLDSASGLTATGGGNVLIRNQNLANVSLGDITANALLAADALHAPIIGSFGGALGTAISDLVVGDVDVANTDISVAGNLRIGSITSGNVTLAAGTLAGGSMTGLAGGSGPRSDVAFGRFTVTASGTLQTSANGLIQADTLGATSVTLNGGNVAASGLRGAVDVSTITSTGLVDVNAWSNNAAGGILDGDIIVGSSSASGATQLLNNSGTAGDVVVGTKVTGTGSITVNAVTDVQIANYDAGADTGLLRSTAGNVQITAGRSVYGIGESFNTVPATGGIAGIFATGDLTVNSTGDVEVNSLGAGGNLTLNIAGALLGAPGTIGTAVAGGALFANGAGNTVFVRAGQALAPTNDVAVFNRVETGGGATIWADQIAVGTVAGTGTLAVGNATGLPLATSDFYIGLQTLVGNQVLNLGTPVPVLTNLITAENITGPGVYGVETLFVGRTAADLVAGTGSVTGTVGNGAQINSITAGTSISLSAGGLVARTVNSVTSTSLTANTGTLSVHTLTAGTSFSLNKNLGAVGALGDELRLVSGTASNGSAGINSNTQARVGSMTATNGNSIAFANGDISGLRQFGQAAVATFATVTDVASPTRLSTNYGAADFTSTTSQAGAQSFGASVQLGTVSGLGASVSGGFGNAVTIDTLSTTGLANATASVGTLAIGSVSGAQSSLQKAGGSLTVDGDDLRVGTMTVNLTATLNSSTHIRASSITSTAGSIGATAGGDVSGFRTATTSDPAYTALEIPLATVVAATASTSDGTLSTRYGAATFNANDVAGDVTITANTGSAQLATVSAGSDATVNARAMAIATATATTGALTLAASTGSLHLASGSSGGLATVTKSGGSSTTDGDELRIATLNAAGGTTITSSTHARLNTIGTTGGSLSVTAGGDISGFKVAAVAHPAPQFAAMVTTGSQLDSRYTDSSLTASTGNLLVTASTGGVQLATAEATLGAVQVDAQAMTIATATAGTTMDLTATLGSLVVGTGSAGGIATLDKQNGSTATNGDDLRVTTFAGATDINLTSSTHVRAGSVTAATDRITVNAIGGDVSGLLTGGFERLPLVTTAAALSANYGKAAFVVNADNATLTNGVQIIAANGGVQLADLAVTGAFSVDARAVSGDVANPTMALFVRATQGTLVLGSAAGPSVQLIKLGGAIGADGDELRVATIASPGLIDVSSATHIRSNSVNSSGSNVVLAATAGDITGIKTGAFALLPTVQAGGGLGTAFSSDYGRITLAAASGTVNFSAGNAAQIDTVSAGGSVTGAAGGLSVGTATAGGALALTANAGTLTIGTASATAGTMTLVKAGGSAATPGDELRIGTGTSPGVMLLTSSTAIRAGTLASTASTATLSATGGDITGLAGASAGTSDTNFGRADLAGSTGLTVTAAGLVQGGTLASVAGPVSVTGGSATADGAVDITTVTALGAVTLRATAIAPLSAPSRDGDILVGSLNGSTITLNNTASGGTSGLIEVTGAATATGDLAVNSVTSARLLGAVTANGNYAVTAAGDVLLGGAAATAQAARGAVMITSTNGSVTQGAGALALTANSDGAGTEALGISARNTVALGNAALIGGDGGRQSAIALTSTTGSTSIGTATGGSMTSTSVTGFVANGAILAGNAASPADALAGPASVDITVSGGGITAQAITATDAGHDIHLGATGAIATGALLAARSVRIDGGTPVTAAASFTGPSVTATAGSIDLRAGSVTASGAVTSGATMNLTTTGAMQLGSASSAGTMTLAAGALTAGSLASADSMAVTATTMNVTGATTSSAAMNLATTGAMQLGSASSTGAMTLAAGALTAGSLASADSMAVIATTMTVTGNTASTGAMNLATTGAMQLAGVNSGSGMTISAGTLDAASLAATGTMAVTASDIDVTGLASSGGTMTLAAGSGPIALGSVTSGAGITASGGAIAVAGATDVAGTANLTATTGAISLAAVTAGQLIASASTGFTASGAIVGGNASLPADAAAGPATVEVVVSNGAISTQAITTSGAGHDIHLGATGAIATGALTATRSVRIDGGTPATAALSFTAPSVAATAGTLDLRADSAAVSGAATSGGAMTLTTTGTTQLGSATSGGTLTANAATLNAGSLTSTGAMQVTAGALAVAGAANSSGTTALITTGTTQLGSASSTGAMNLTASALTVGGATSSGAGITIATTGATQLASINAAGALAIMASNVNVAGAASSSGSSVTIGAGSGPVQLGSTSSGGAMTVTGGAITVTGAASAGSAMAFDATATTLNIGSASASGAVTLAARTRATLGTVSGGSNAVTVTAADADINGAVTGSLITVVNRGAAGNDFRLGTGAPGTGGFVLDSAEINRLAAATVVFDAGTATGATRQDVGIGALDLTNAALRNLNVYALQRIDLTGSLSRGSGSALESLRLGGTATPADLAAVIRGGGSANPNELAAVLRIAAKADGSGGKIDIGSARAELRAAMLGAGQDTGFLDQLAVIEGGVPAGVTPWTAADMVSNGASSLYNSTAFGGLVYQQGAAGPAQVHVTASKLTVIYSNFALFQNTGAFSGNEGVLLGTQAAPVIPALTVFGPNPPDGGPFAIFGKLNGIGNTATALLGPSVIEVGAVDRTTARINGCLIGSGAGCLTTLALTPAIGNIDPVRANIFFPDADFKLPFDPLVGTNNDSLFGDVGTFGLGDIPMTPIECAEGDTSPACTSQKEGAQK